MERDSRTDGTSSTSGSWHWETENLGLVLGIVGGVLALVAGCCCLGWWL